MALTKAQAQSLTDSRTEIKMKDGTTGHLLRWCPHKNVVGIETGTEKGVVFVSKDLITDTNGELSEDK